MHYFNINTLKIENYPGNSPEWIITIPKTLHKPCRFKYSDIFVIIGQQISIKFWTGNSDIDVSFTENPRYVFECINLNYGSLGSFNQQVRVRFEK